jgi:hypothetical protein
MKSFNGANKRRFRTNCRSMLSFPALYASAVASVI